LHFTYIKSSQPEEVEDFFLEFLGHEVSEMEVNGKSLDDYRDRSFWKKEHFLFIPKSLLKHDTTNTVIVSFDNKYSKDGFGFHSFVDTDKNQYVYSNFAPHHAFKMFPCFDQPDIKGTYSLLVSGPSDWVTLSNEICREVTSGRPSSTCDSPSRLAQGHNSFFQTNEPFSTFTFEVTKPISTYLFTVIAGPFKKIESENPFKGIPMALYCRESLHEHLKQDVDMIFEVTIESMKWYENFFGYQFPFSKYDQIFCPEFYWGAMENPGAVIFNDNKVNRSKVKTPIH
jgi:aminopeptidase N